jgi:large subunit ribosomal protein L28
LATTSGVIEPGRLDEGLDVGRADRPVDEGVRAALHHRAGGHRAQAHPIESKGVDVVEQAGDVLGRRIVLPYITRQARSMVAESRVVDIVFQSFGQSPNPLNGENVTMASVCEVCGKKPSWGMSVSHSHRRTKRRWNPNIQRVRALVSGSAKRVNVCTGCLKSGKIVKAG